MRLKRPVDTLGAYKSDAAEQEGAFLEQAAHCEGRSPLYADLCRSLAQEPLVPTVVDAWTWEVPLRLLAGLHYLVLEGQATWADVPGALERHAEFLREFVASQPVQTNEVQRSWVLLPCFLHVAERTRAPVLDLIELGPSAGLNLVWDRYAYRYREGAWGAGDAPLTFTGDERRGVPERLLALAPTVRGRIGIDRAPVDVTSDDGARLLESFVWPDQRDRLARLRSAIRTLRAAPPALVEGDFVELLPHMLAERRVDGLTIVFQTAALGYVDEQGRDRVRRALRREGERGSLAFVTAGRPRRGERVWGLRVVVWPDGEREFVGHADYHGTWLDWER